MKWNVPNTISVIRILLILPAMFLLYYGSYNWKLMGVSLIITSFILDGIDGYLARALDQVTTFGSLLDVLADRLVEYMLWIFYMGVGLIPLWAPLIVIPRGVLTDMIRTRAEANGISVYDLPRGRLAKALVSNRATRLIFGALKLVLFSILGLEMAGFVFPGDLVLWLVVITILLNLARGIPVILEGSRFLD